MSLEETERRRYLHEMGFNALWVRRTHQETAEKTAEGSESETESAQQPATPVTNLADKAAGKHPILADSAYDMQPIELPETQPDAVAPPPVESRAPTSRMAPAPLAAPSVRMRAAPPPTDWESLTQNILQCHACGLGATRTQVVPGVGDKNARWLFVGEGPGYYEDQQGEPFVGRSGKLLDNMLTAIGLARGKNAYIANIVKCRAANALGKDRPPEAEEIQSCIGYLAQQIALIKPEIIIALGRTAALSLLDMPADTTIAALRGKIHACTLAGISVPLIVTYHPAYLLRTPMAKKQAWTDLCLALETHQPSSKE